MNCSLDKDTRLLHGTRLGVRSDLHTPCTSSNARVGEMKAARGLELVREILLRVSAKRIHLADGLLRRSPCMNLSMYREQTVNK